MSKIISKYVEVLVFRRNKNLIEYLILQRGTKEKIYPNIWQVITGKIKKNENAIQTAIRELKEETFLKPISLWKINYINSFYDEKNDEINLNPMFAVEIDFDSKIKISNEHQKYIWCVFNKCQKLLVWRGQKETIKIFHKLLQRKNQKEIYLTKIDIA